MDVIRIFGNECVQLAILWLTIRRKMHYWRMAWCLQSSHLLAGSTLHQAVGKELQALELEAAELAESSEDDSMAADDEPSSSTDAQLQDPVSEERPVGFGVRAPPPDLDGTFFPSTCRRFSCYSAPRHTKRSAGWFCRRKSFRQLQKEEAKTECYRLLDWQSRHRENDCSTVCIFDSEHFDVASIASTWLEA